MKHAIRKVRKKHYLFSAAIIALASANSSIPLVYAQTSENGPFPTTTADSSFRVGQLEAAIFPPSLNGNLLNIYKTTTSDIRFFFPYVEVFEEDIEGADNSGCQDQTGWRKIQLNAYIYDKTLIDEIKSELVKQGISAKNVAIPPNAGLVFFREMSDGQYLKVFSTIPQISLLGGASLSEAGAGTQKSLQSEVSVPCSDNEGSLGGSSNYLVLMIASGAPTDISFTSLYADAILQSGLRADLLNSESEVDVSTVTTSQGGGGISFNLGFAAGNFGSTESSSTTSASRSRIINRTWLTDKINDISLEIQVNTLCERALCNKSDQNEKIIDLLLNSLEKGVIDVTSDNQRLHAKLPDGSTPPLDTIKINEQLKQSLEKTDTLNNNQELTEGGVTYKKNSDSISDLSTNTEWKRDGDDWIPTKFEAYIVEADALLRKLSSSVSNEALGELQQIAYSLPTFIKGGDEYGTAASEKMRESITTRLDSLHGYFGTPEIKKGSSFRDMTKINKFGTTYINDNFTKDIRHVQVRSISWGGCGIRGYVDDILVAVHESHLPFNGLATNTICEIEMRVKKGSSYRIEHGALALSERRTYIDDYIKDNIKYFVMQYSEEAVSPHALMWHEAEFDLIDSDMYRIGP